MNPETGPLPGCDRLVAGKAARKFPRDMRRLWSALAIVAWTGKPGPVAFKLLPLMYPPFRAVVFNEAGGFFAPGPALVAGHLRRRMRDSLAAKLQLVSEWSAAAAQLTISKLWDAAQWFFWCMFHAGLGIWRAGERLVNVLHWIVQLLFALLAFLATPTAPLSRLAVQRAQAKTWRQKGHEQKKRVQKTEGRRVEPSGRASTPAIEITIPGRGWPRRAVFAAAAETDAEFIVFRRPGEQASVAPLIALARQTNAFAVARQSAYSAWRDCAIRKHPFRRLQPGEVSEVFAPHSSLIVVRRSALLRFGVPRALTYGGALAMIFWKTSAVGLRSYVVGHDGPITDEPAMALEDAELALRLTLPSSLSKFCPQRAARSRGNVAWSPSRVRGSRGKKPRVLIVSPYLPFPLSHGGAVRIYNLCRSLADRVDFVLASFHEADERVCYDELHEVFREVFVVDVDRKFPAIDVPRQVAEYRSAAMADLIRGLCSDRKVDLVQLEYTQMAEYREHTGGVPVILVEHDITFTLYSQLAEFNGQTETREEARRWRGFERAALQCSNAVWAVSQDERAIALEHGAPRARTRVIPNGVDIRRFKPEAKPAGPPVVLFVGSFRHLPNLLAFEALRTLVMPEVWRQCPEAILHVIAGPGHETAAQTAARTSLLVSHSNVVVEGFVSDVRPAYRSADVVAVPLPLSAGTNIKLLEAMACGRAIVSTASGCRGLGLTSGVELIVAELDDTFASGVVTLLRDINLRTRMAAEARRTAERRFGWEAIAQEALKSYAELMPVQRPLEAPQAVLSRSR